MTSVIKHKTSVLGMTLELLSDKLEHSVCFFTAEYLLVDSPSVGGSFFFWIGSNILDPSVHDLDLSFGLDLVFGLDL